MFDVANSAGAPVNMPSGEAYRNATTPTSAGRMGAANTAGRGSIVSIAAVEGLRGSPAGAVFSAAKAGVIVLTETLVRECQPAGIRVNAVIPALPAPHGRSNEDNSAGVGKAVAFLLSDAAAQTTGSCLDVSGGWALH